MDGGFLGMLPKSTKCMI